MRGSRENRASRRKTFAPPKLGPDADSRNLDPVAVLLHQRVALGLAQILAHHFLDELLEARLSLPAQFLLRPGGIADEGVDFGGTEIARVHGDDFFSRGVERVLVYAFAVPLEADVEPCRREIDEFAHA